MPEAHMNSTGDSMDARQARDALAAACAARTAARRTSEANERTRPRRYDIGQGLTFAAAFSAFGLAELMPRYGILLLLTGAAFVVGFFALVWIAAHHGGVARWFSRDGGPRQSAWDLWVAPFLCLAIGGLAAIPYGGAGWLIAFGLATGAERVLRAFRRQGGTA
jgi:hypothetical protein